MNINIDALCNPDLIIFDLHNTLLLTKYTNHSMTVNENLIDGSEDLIEYFSKNNKNLAVVSDFFQSAVQAQIESSSVSEYFDLLVGFDTWQGPDYEYYPKPSKTLGNKIKEEFDFLDENACIWMIGDGNKDIAFAENNGFEFIGYDNYKCEHLEDCLNYANYEDLLKDIKNSNW